MQHQQRPQPALLLSTYGQLQTEVAAGILDHFHHPQPCSWSGSQYKLPKDAAQDDALPDHSRHSLILAGCGFPVEQLPDDLRLALLASRQTPADLRTALHDAVTASSSSGKDIAGPSKAAASSSSSSSTGGNASGITSSSGSSGNDPYTSCGAWAEGFHQLCSASVELGLPLAMHPHLPMPQQQTFLQYVDQLRCHQLSTIMARHRQYLRQVVQEWPLLGTQGCIAAKDYQPKQWVMEKQLPNSSGMAVDCYACLVAPGQHLTKTKVAVLDVAGTAGRVAKALRLLLGQWWQELPWLCKDGKAGLVLAGGALGTYMGKPGSVVGHHDFDFFVIAPDKASYLRVVHETRASFDQALDAWEPDAEAAGSDAGDPIRHSWVWKVLKQEKDTAALLGVLWVHTKKRRGVGSCKPQTDPITHTPLQVKLIRWPFCSPAALVHCCDMPNVAAWFDGEEVFLDERCAWCHANRLLLADPIFDNPVPSSTSPGRLCRRLVNHSARLPGYAVLVPGPLSGPDFIHIANGLAAVLKPVKAAVCGTKGPSNATGGQKSGVKHCLGVMAKRATAGIERWALMLACHKVFGFVPVERPAKQSCEGTDDPPVESFVDVTPEQQYSTAMAGLADAQRKGLPFGGFFQPTLGGDAGGAALGDANTWFSVGCLEELPRRLWLAVNGFVEYEAAGRTG